MSKAVKYYEERIKENKIKEEELRKVSQIFAITRLVVALIGGIFAYEAYTQENIVNVVLSIGIALIIVIALAIIHSIKNKKRRYHKIIIDVNEKGLKRLNGEWKAFEDNGEEFLNEKHGFSDDLDIFGQGSLFQLINTTKTKFGRKALAKILSLETLPKKNEIVERQDAIKELCEKVQWRQNLIAEATINKSGIADTEKLLEWIEKKEEIPVLLKILPYTLTGITLIVLLLAVLKVVPISFMILILLFNYVIIKATTKPLGEVIQILGRHKQDIEAYSNLLALIEKEDFKAKILVEVKSKVVEDRNVSPTVEMKSLKNLVYWVGDSNANAYYLILNVLFMSDMFILKNIMTWKNKNGDLLRGWLDAMGEIEALSSIANLAFDNEEYSFANIVEEKLVEGTMIGHPLIGEKAIRNSVKLENEVLLITGSNMSGKSTFLRTIGLNLVLAYIGAPNYSNEFSCGIFNIYTCMRTKDNLEENTSSFYAEILKIKKLIQASQKGEKVFFLLDEIFKGTNSIDRHEGAKVLINQLYNVGGVGLVSTHDLELCELENKYKWIKNYNFQEYYEENKIKFDYKLRVGASQTRNAIHLMKLAGIDFK